ncbi:hypothetical protein AVEN_191305-1, partial [Araneus ventricosus]
MIEEQISNKDVLQELFYWLEQKRMRTRDNRITALLRSTERKHCFFYKRLTNPRGGELSDVESQTLRPPRSPT